MMLLGFRASYDGEFGNASVVQAGRWKIIHLRVYDAIPFGLATLMAEALESGAQFLVIDPQVKTSGKAEFIDVPMGQMMAA